MNFDGGAVGGASGYFPLGIFAGGAFLLLPAFLLVGLILFAYY